MDELEFSCMDRFFFKFLLSLDVGIRYFRIAC